jgi:hypothetical protein
MLQKLSDLQPESGARLNSSEDQSTCNPGGGSASHGQEKATARADTGEPGGDHEDASTSTNPNTRAHRGQSSTCHHAQDSLSDQALQCLSNFTSIQTRVRNAMATIHDAKEESNSVLTSLDKASIQEDAKARRDLQTVQTSIAKRQTELHMLEMQRSAPSLFRPMQGMSLLQSRVMRSQACRVTLDRDRLEHVSAPSFTTCAEMR